MTLQVHRIPGRTLVGNPLGDPAERDLHVYLPPDFDPARRYPALLAVVGFTGTGGMLFNIDPLGEDLGRKLDRLITTGACPPCIVVAPDCFTRVGGNQYINSSATGRYEDYLLEEVLPFVAATYQVGRWGVFGKSSGGYGAMLLGMRHPDVFAALADHSGDSCFELCYLGDWAAALDEFRAAGGPTAWLDRFWADANRHRARHDKPLDMLAMAAHYSPLPGAPHLGIDFPFDLETGEFRPAVWDRWREWDPVNLVPRYAAGMKSLRLIYIDCGRQDEYGLQWGARALTKRLRAAGLTVTHEEFDDGHSHLGYRYDTSLPLLVRALVD